MSEREIVVVGASLAGSAAATLLARQGARVTVVEKAPDPGHHKTVCGHFIQAGAVPAIERLGVLEPLLDAGAVLSHSRLWTRFGRIESDTVPPSLNIRRSKMDPIVRRHAADTPGVDLLLGEQVVEVLDGGVSLRSGRTLKADLVVGADGRDSTVARLAGVPEKVTPNNRFSYGAYYEGPPPQGAPDGTVWLLDPHWAAAFPTDDGLTLYACMLTHDRLGEFKGDVVGALERFVSALPDAPPILESTRVGEPLGKLRMPNRMRRPVGAKLALVGDAALATDPLWGVGCGWAFESADRLAAALAPWAQGEESLDRGLRRYRREWTRWLRPHVRMIHGYSSGRPFDAVERRLYTAAARDPKVAEATGRIGVRMDSPLTMLRPSILRRVARAGGGAQAPEAPRYSSTTSTSPSLTA